MDEPSRTIHRDRTCHPSTAVKQGRDAAGAIAALFDFGAVRVEYTVEDCGIRTSRCLEHERLVIADTGVTVRQTPELLGTQHGLASGRIEHDKVVAHSMHLREIDAHVHRITETVTVRSAVST